MHAGAGSLPGNHPSRAAASSQGTALAVAAAAAGPRAVVWPALVARVLSNREEGAGSTYCSSSWSSDSGG